MFQRITFAIVLILVQLLLMSIFAMAQAPKELEDFVWIELGEENDEHGLIQFDFPNDGKTEVVKEGNPKKECRLSPGRLGPDKRSSYIYFQIDDTFLSGGTNEVWIITEYLDSDQEQPIECHYDGVDAAYKEADVRELGGTNEWLFHTWHITDGKFENSQNGNSDFRIRSYSDPIWLNRVWVSLIDPPDSFNPAPNESWPWDVEPLMTLATTWGTLKR